jgi:hypothetical protein
MPTRSRSSTTTDLLPNPHPGEILLEEFLKPMALSQTALANAIHVPPRRINEIVLGKRAITQGDPAAGGVGWVNPGEGRGQTQHNSRMTMGFVLGHRCRSTQPTCETPRTASPGSAH